MTPESLCPPPLDRRRFLGLAGAAVLAPGALAVALSEQEARPPFAAAALRRHCRRSRRRMIQMNGYAIDAETPLDALTTYLTPNDLFFVRHHWNPQYPSRKGWALDGRRRGRAAAARSRSRTCAGCRGRP